MPGLASPRQGSEQTLVGDAASGPPPELAAFAWDRDGTLWLACFYGGIYRFRDGKFTRFDAYNSPIADSGASALCVDINDVKWFGTPRGYVYSFDGKIWKTHAKLGKIIERIRKDDQGRIWLVGSDLRLGLTYLPDETAQEPAHIEFPARRDPAHQSEEQIQTLDIDGAGNVWVATTQGIAQYDGRRWSYPNRGELAGRPVRDVWCDRRNGAVWFAVGNELHRYQGGQWTISTPPSPGSEQPIGRICGSHQGLAGVLYHGGGGASVLKKGRWESVGPGTPLANDWLTGIAPDQQGHLWFIGRRGGLRCFDGTTWTTFPAVERALNPSFDRRLIWRRTPLSNLIAEREVEADIHDVLKNPRACFGKKLRFLGTTESSFEYADFVDENGKKLNMWPDAHPELSDLLREMGGLEKKLKEAKLNEIVGYLEFGGYYGHMGGWAQQFFITEIYPASPGSRTKAEVKQQLLQHLERTRADRWILPLPEDETLREARQALQGTWVLESETARGKTVTVTERQEYVFREDRLTIRSGERTIATGYRIDPWQNPLALDQDGRKGIYRVEGDRLTICFGLSDAGHRPRTFETSKDTDVTLLVFRRPASDGQAPTKKANPAPEREDGLKAQSAQNLKRLGMAMHNFYDRHHQFPAAILDKPVDTPALKGGTAHSWRVALLPYLGHRDLYHRYDFEEPWDGPNNLKLLGEMPAVYRHPTTPAEKTYTAYFLVTGPGTVHDGSDKTEIKDITDGTSNTLHIAETVRHIPWTKPEDIAYHPGKPLPELGGYYEGNFFVGLVDATSALVDKTIDETALRRLIEKGDGNPFGWLPHIRARW